MLLSSLPLPAVLASLLLGATALDIPPTPTVIYSVSGDSTISTRQYVAEIEFFTVSGASGSLTSEVIAEATIHSPFKDGSNHDSQDNLVAKVSIDCGDGRIVQPGATYLNAYSCWAVGARATTTRSDGQMNVAGAQIGGRLEVAAVLGAAGIIGLVGWL